ncbi:hypothetical protein Tco_0754225 [Tanacetum coccineum]
MSMWDAEFYNKVDDNVHVNIVSQFRSLTSFILFAATLGHTLVRHKKKKKAIQRDKDKAKLIDTLQKLLNCGCNMVTTLAT